MGGGFLSNLEKFEKIYDLSYILSLENLTICKSLKDMLCRCRGCREFTKIYFHFSSRKENTFEKDGGGGRRGGEWERLKGYPDKLFYETCVCFIIHGHFSVDVLKSSHRAIFL